MPLSLRRKGSLSSIFNGGKGHRRSASDPSIKEPQSSTSQAGAQARHTLGVPLSPLHEKDRATSPRRPPPSAFRGVRPAPPSPSPKGKERAVAPPMQQRPGRAHWVVDSLESRRGNDLWLQQNRVILVLGEPSRAALAPLLYSPAFADTLVLVGSLDPIPEIELLNSPSHLLHSDTIYPTVQPFQPPESAISDAAHPLTAILQCGVALAEQYRRETTGTPTIPARPGSFGPRSRRGSQSSLGSTPPGTPGGRRKRGFSFGNKTPVEGSQTPISRNGSLLDLTRLSSAVKENRSRTPSVYEGKERHTLHRRVSSFFRNEAVVSDGSPIDAIVNFIPFADPHADQQRVLQDMLQNTVVLTTATLPILATTVTSTSVHAQAAISEMAPLSLIHIVPVDAPLQLPTVIERFLLPLLPTMAGRVRRPLFGVVTGYGAWLAQNTDTANDGLPGAETLLFGGVRCPANIAEAEGVKQQAMLAGWDHCCASPGLLVEAAENTHTPPMFSRRASSMALSELRTQPVVTSGRPNPSTNTSTSSQSVRSVASSSPSSPSLAMSSGSLPPGAAPARSTSPTAALRATSPVKNVSPPQPKRAELPKAAVSKTKTPSPPPVIVEPPVGSTTARATPSRTPRPLSDTYRRTPLANEYARAESTPRPKHATAPSSPSTAEPQFVSRFDPRYQEFEARRAEAEKAQAKEALRATLSPSHGSSNLSAYTNGSSLPKGAAPPRGPSGLRNAVTIPQHTVAPSPPTPELDTSSSSCSSSSVLEPNWSEERSGGSASAGSSKRSSSAPSASVPASIPTSKSTPNMKRTSLSFTSIFKRRGVKA